MATRPTPTPVVLSGPPSAVRGVVSLANTGDARLVIRGAVLHLPKRPPITASLTALVAPGVTAEAAVSADLGADWPAGSVRGELEVNGQRRDVELRVAQRIGMTVAPSEVLAAPGTTAVDVLARNTGNVPVQLARVVKGRLRWHDSGDPHVDDPDATLTIPKAVTLHPGEESLLQASIEIPDGLARDRRHHARLPIGPADLGVIVLPSDPPASKPRTSRKSTARSKES